MSKIKSGNAVIVNSKHELDKLIRLAKGSIDYNVPWEGVDTFDAPTLVGYFDNYCNNNWEVCSGYHETHDIEYFFKILQNNQMKKTLYNLEIGDQVDVGDGDVKIVLGKIESSKDNPLYVMSKTYDHEMSDNTWSAKEMENKGWKFKDVDEKVEFTLDEIAEKFDVDVKNLKIKK